MFYRLYYQNFIVKIRIKKIHNENLLLQNFRSNAPSLGLMDTPQRDHTDEWLFLAQHVGLPTRLLDWTEGLLVALFFALKENKPVIWMLDPDELNRKSLTGPLNDNEFGLTWFNPSQYPITREEFVKALFYLMDKSKQQKPEELLKLIPLRPSISNINIRGAWGLDNPGSDLPVAIHPTNIHVRMHTQKSRFTIHGKKKQSIAELVDNRVLRKYVIPPKYKKSFIADLRMIGFTYTSVYPDLDNLAKELSETY